MDKIHYPPIPGAQSKGRGRPSLAEMAERKIYWEKNGGAPSAAQVTAPASTQQISVKRAEPAITQQVISDKEYLPEDIQKLLPDYIVWSKDEQKTLKAILDQLPDSKRGRPSKEDVQAKQLVKEKITKLVVAKIQTNPEIAQAAIASASGSNVSTTEDVTSSIAMDVIAIAPIFGFNQFKFGDQVRPVTAPMTKKHMGVVWRHDIGTRSVFVAWRGGYRFWCDVSTLLPFKATREELDQIMSEEEGPDDK